MVGKYIIETKNEVIYGLLDFYGHETGPESLKKTAAFLNGAALKLISYYG